MSSTINSVWLKIQIGPLIQNCSAYSQPEKDLMERGCIQSVLPPVKYMYRLDVLIGKL